MIYIIRAGADGPVKIGYAASVERRVAVLQAGNHERLALLRTVPGGRKTETWLHRRFAAGRIEREWFRFDVVMLTVEPPVEMARQRVITVPQSAWDLIDGLAANLAKPNARRMWKSRGIVPARHRGALMEMAAARGIALRWADLGNLAALS